MIDLNFFFKKKKIIDRGEICCVVFFNGNYNYDID